MLTIDPNNRIGTGEVWSIIDDLKEKVVKNKYQTEKKVIPVMMNKSSFDYKPPIGSLA